MFFGLHAVPFAVACVFTFVMTIFVIFAARLRHLIEEKLDRKAVAQITGATVVMLVVMIAVTYFVVSGLESDRDARDAFFRVKLGSAGIVVVDSSGENNITVRSGDCTATYTIRKDASASQPKVWPLLPGSATIVEGCGGVNLDQTFIRR